MQDAYPAGWSGESQLSIEMLGSLYELNHRFIGLIGRSDAPTGASQPAWFVGPASVAAQVLSPEQQQAVARCPYALFDLCFQDEGHWGALHDAGAWRVADQFAADDEAVEFVRLALFFAWHLATTSTLSAQLVLGMNAATAAAFRRITVDRLPALAVAETGRLTVRWGHCAVYWNALVNAALRCDATILRRVQLFGLQLTAAARLPPLEAMRRKFIAAGLSGGLR
jgi:hypothetical protein